MTDEMIDTPDAVPEPPNDEVSPLVRDRVVSNFLAAWMQGEPWAMQTRNATVLKKMVASKVEQELAKSPAKTRVRSRPPTEEDKRRIIEAFLAAYASPPLRSDLNKRSVAQLEGLIAQEAQRRAPEYVEDASMDEGAEAVVESMSARVQELEHHTDRLRREVSRAHDWRYHLESRCREARDGVDHYLNVARRAPTEDEMLGIYNLLTEGIEWTG